MFVVDSVAAGIGKKTLLRGVSFTVERGTMTAIVGINGVGKSTLLRALGGIAKPHAGQVLIDAANVHAIKPRHRATLMTLVGQEESPPGDLTVAEMVALGRLPYLKSWQLGSSKEKDIIARSLATVGISDLADRPCDRLSGGQRRRALLARGFAQETDLVLLDEPTNHLDVHHQLHLLSVLKNSGRTIVATIHEEAQAALVSEDGWTAAAVGNAVHELEYRVVRDRILAKEPRIDGRDTVTVRPITIRTGVLPRVHGSALFTRGETQALVVTTLGTSRDAQIIDALTGEYRDIFMLHYNFPPFSVGEVGRVGSPKRREIGHGRLARRGVTAILPKESDFPYTIRVVSEITESNGSSSMASVCGTSLALMDAGVPVKTPVAGIAMGLVKEGDRFTVLTDILGDEDHLGDMDFKVAGSVNGVTALQMDIKIDGIPREIMEQALTQAKAGRLHILEVMNQAIAAPRAEISEFAPRFTTMRIDVEKIKDVIGKGGATIRSITESTGTTIEIEDDGTIKIAAVDKTAADDARRIIEEITAEPEIGRIYDAKVVKITDFGAFVAFLPGKEGLVHVSQIADYRVTNVEDELSVGQEVKVKLLEIDRQGRVRLSIKEAKNPL